MKEWNGFKVGDKVRMLIDTRGDTPHGIEVEYPAGTIGVIDQIAYFGKEQGWGVEVVIGDAEGDAAIVNSFDDRDVREEQKYFFEKF